MSGLSGVSSASSAAASMMQVLDDTIQSQTDMAQKFIKIAAEEKIQAAEMTGIGQLLDIYA